MLHLNDSTSVATVMTITPDSIYYFHDGYKKEKIEVKNGHAYKTKQATILVGHKTVLIESEFRTIWLKNGEVINK